MSVRLSGNVSVSIAAETNLGGIDHEILAEKAASLGNAGRKVETTLGLLRSHHGDDDGRARLVRSAAEAVYGYFVQRELCGFRRHDDVIADYAIPREVLARLGAK